VTVLVTPQTFVMVHFDAEAIRAVVERLIAAIGLPAAFDVTVNVDETVPLGRATVTSIEPAVIEVEGGALEDPKRPRQLSEAGTADILGQLLWQVHDRLDPSFGPVPPDDSLSLAHQAAWDVYSVGRLARRGYRAQRQRRLYAFRIRHGFSDEADAAFDRLWSAERLTWLEVVALSDAAGTRIGETEAGRAQAGKAREARSQAVKAGRAR
jgi:hypothetical protein